MPHPLPVSAASLQAAAAGAPAQPSPGPAAADTRVDQIRAHMERYKQLASQGKLAEAGKELDAIQELFKK